MNSSHLKSRGYISKRRKYRRIKRKNGMVRVHEVDLAPQIKVLQDHYQMIHLFVI